MKASEVIELLAREIRLHGDKEILVNQGEGTWYALHLVKAGRFYKNDIKDGKWKNMYLDIDFT